MGQCPNLASLFFFFHVWPKILELEQSSELAKRNLLSWVIVAFHRPHLDVAVRGG